MTDDEANLMGAVYSPETSDGRKRDWPKITVMTILWVPVSVIAAIGIYSLFATPL